MLDWLKKTQPMAGSVLFRGTLPPRAEDFAELGAYDISIEPIGHSGKHAHWAIRMQHPTWGEADAICLRDIPPPPRVLIDWDARLSPSERTTAYQGRSTVTVKMDSRKAHILRDRKMLLRFLGAIMGNDGVVAIDHTSERFWSRAALDDELMHDADLDIDALYTLHAVGSDDDADQKITWLHTHGLGALGFFDFDVLNPSDDIAGPGLDALRAIAFAIVEGTVTASTPNFKLASRGGIRFVEAGDFMKRASSASTALRNDPAGDHLQRRAVICQPQGFMGRMFDNPQPSKLLSGPIDESIGLVFFSEDASDLQGERARGTYSLLRKVADELRPFEFTIAVKMGYEQDGRHSREHLWFEAHNFSDKTIDATLRSQPFHIAAMKEGQRGQHPVSHLTDWMIMTPAGMISPRDTSALRKIREKWDQLLALKRSDGMNANAR